MGNANRSDEPTQQIESFALRTFRQSRLAIASPKAKEKQRSRTSQGNFASHLLLPQRSLTSD